MSFRTLLESRKKRIDTRLAELLQTSTPEFSGLYEAMNYSLNAGGKRIRPVLFLAVLAWRAPWNVFIPILLFTTTCRLWITMIFVAASRQIIRCTETARPFWPETDC